MIMIIIHMDHLELWQQAKASYTWRQNFCFTDHYYCYYDYETENMSGIYNDHFCTIILIVLVAWKMKN